jgi:hypothetical protein
MRAKRRAASPCLASQPAAASASQLIGNGIFCARSAFEREAGFFLFGLMAHPSTASEVEFRGLLSRAAAHASSAVVS